MRLGKVKSLLAKLDVQVDNPGVCLGSSQGWLPGGGDYIESYNPVTNGLIARVVSCDSSQYQQVVRRSKQTYRDWRLHPAPKRGDVVRDLGNILREYMEPLGELVSLEMGKILSEGVGEVQEMIDICDFATGLSRQLHGLTMHSERFKHRMYEQWHPLGTVGIISAFNFPVAVWAWNATVAAVCGNTTVWKPSELTPLVAIAVQKLVNKVSDNYSIEGVFNLVIGGAEIGKSLVKDENIPLVSFTGSTKVGREVGAQVAARFGKSILELGGNNAIILTENADISMAVRAITFGAVGTTGQRCTTSRRLIVHHSVVTQLQDKLVQAYKTLNIGNPLEKDVLVGPLVHQKSVEDMKFALKRAKDQGGEVLYGGQSVREDLGTNFVIPALVKMPDQTKIVKEETFAPILYIMEYENLEQAIEMQNEVDHGLSSAIFTDSIKQSEVFLSAVGSDCGIANVNIGTSGAEIGGAFGGEKHTGGGRESGSDAWKSYMRRQTNTINWSDDLPLAQGVVFE